jgi:hypothetical protein
VVVLATIIGGLVLKANAADTGTPEVTTLTTSLNNTNPPAKDFGFSTWCNRGFGGRMGHKFGFNIDRFEVSSGYTEKVNGILNSDPDVQNLLTQGYNVTRINPVIERVVESDGTVTAKASSAIVSLKGPSGHATVYIDVDSAKVLKIVILTRTVIDKSTS